MDIQDTPDQSGILSLIGPLQSPIPRVPKDNKKQIKDFLTGSRYSKISAQSEIVLRTHLSIGITPPLQTIKASTIVAALELGDILRHSKRLCFSLKTIDAYELFSGLLIAVRNVADQPPDHLIRKIITSIRKWMKWLNKEGGVLTEQTEAALMDLFIFVVLKAAPSGKLSREKINKIEKMITPVLEFSLDISARSPFWGTFMRVMKLLQIIRKRYSSSFLESVVEDEIRHQLFEETVKRMPEFIKMLAGEGRLDKMKEMAEAVRDIYFADTKYRETIHALWDADKESLIEEVQHFIIEYLNIDEGIKPKGIILADKSEAMYVSHLATSLLCSWEAREDSQKAKDAFNILRSVADKFFHLRICGEIRCEVKFDPQFHEFPDSAIGEGQVSIVRPWVEWLDKSRRKVIIRAIVQKSK